MIKEDLKVHVPDRGQQDCFAGREGQPAERSFLIGSFFKENCAQKQDICFRILYSFPGIFYNKNERK